MMAKKRIFISMPWLHIGGAESSLIGLLQSLDYSKVEVDLFLLAHEGELMPHIPKEVNLLPEDPAYAAAQRGRKYAWRVHQYKVWFAHLLARMRMAAYVRIKHPINYDAGFIFSGVELTKALPDINPSVEYDLALSFVDPHNYILDHVRAKKKVGWIHTDYTQIDVNKRLEGKILARLDYIALVSKTVRDSFLKVFPALADKAIEIENILSPTFIKNRASEYYPQEFTAYADSGTAILCSVGRLCEAKNYDNIPYMALELTKLTEDFHWFVIGPGDFSAIEKTAERIGVASHVSFIGPKDNPYPYLKHCTVYVHPSRYEGKSVVVREAQMLCKPVVITNYPTASSQVEDGRDGLIVDLDNRSIANGIYMLLRDENAKTRICKNLEERNYGNGSEVEKIYALTR